MNNYCQKFKHKQCNECVLLSTQTTHMLYRNKICSSILVSLLITQFITHQFSVTEQFYIIRLCSMQVVGDQAERNVQKGKFSQHFVFKTQQ